MANPTQPNQAASTVHNVSAGMWRLWEEKSWQPQKQKPASSKACPAEPGARLPTHSHRHKPLLPLNHSCISCSCLHTAEKAVSSICLWHTTVNMEQTQADGWGRSHARYPDVFSGVQGPQLTASPGPDSLICGVLGPHPISSSNMSS